MSSIFNITEYILLYNNKLNDVIPANFGGDKTKYIDLTSNNLSGSIPEEIFNLPLLEYVYFSNNKFSGAIPSTIGNGPQLKDIWFEDNLLTGNIPAIVEGQLPLIGTYKQLYLNNMISYHHVTYLRMILL